MKVSEQWLYDWVKPNLSIQELASLLTMSGLEVDQIHPVAAKFTGVVVAHVLSTQPHPEADKLTLCQVDAGEPEPLSIVCGASNVRPGLKVALAKVGAVLPNGMTIKPAKLRGQVSQGMLRSAEELGMSSKSEGIIELDSQAPVGQNLREYLLLDDQVLDIDLTPNRGDCLNMEGIAREVCTKLKIAFPAITTSSATISTDQLLAVEVKAPQACPLYIGRMITGIKLDAVTPLWMKERLSRAGIRPIHPVVDVTQYVMLEMGQPLHAFDAKKINEKIVVRYACGQEKLTLLDGQIVSLFPQTLVIADSHQVLALAGIMGGENSAVSEDTTQVFLESAFFTPTAMAGVARRYGLSTDASYRYERGVDPNLPERAIERATELLQEITGCVVGELTKIKQSDVWFTPKVIEFRPEKVEKHIGIHIDETEIKRILLALGFSIHPMPSSNSWQVIIPTYRFDISIEEDLIEEVIRIYGYDQLPATKTVAALRPGHVDLIEDIDFKAAEIFSTLGYQQCITYSFVDPDLQNALFPNATSLKLVNPLSPELSQMRMSLWPGLLASMLYNLNRQQEEIALFETGSIFDISSGTLVEIPKIGALLTGITGSLDWDQSTRPLDFYDLKGHVESLFKHFGLQDIRFESAEHPSLHPGKSACLLFKEQIIGWCGALHPRLAQLLDLTAEVYLFECNQTILKESQKNAYSPVSKFPRIRRDLALLVDQGLAFSAIESMIRSVEDQGILKSIHLFDVYTGASIPEGKKSIAIALFMQRNDRTMNDLEVNGYIDAIIEKLEKKLSIIVRDGSS